MIGKHVELCQNRYDKNKGGYWYDDNLEAKVNYADGLKIVAKLRPLTKFEHYIYYGIEL